MVLEDELAEEGLPVPGDGVHPVEGHAGADGGEGVPGEIEVGHGIHGKGIVIPLSREEVPQPPAALAQLALADAGHHGGDHLPVRHFAQILLQALPHPGVPDVRLVQELAEKRLAHLAAGDGIDHQVREVHHLHPLLAQALGEGIVLLLRLPQVGDVVKQQPLQILRHQVLQLSAGAVQQDLFQPPDLAGIVQAGFQPRFRWHRASLLFCR